MYHPCRTTNTFSKSFSFCLWCATADVPKSYQLLGSLTVRTVWNVRARRYVFRNFRSVVKFDFYHRYYIENWPYIAFGYYLQTAFDIHNGFFFNLFRFLPRSFSRARWRAARFFFFFLRNTTGAGVDGLRIARCTLRAPIIPAIIIIYVPFVLSCIRARIELSIKNRFFFLNCTWVNYIYISSNKTPVDNNNS